MYWELDIRDERVKDKGKRGIVISRKTMCYISFCISNEILIRGTPKSDETNSSQTIHESLTDDLRTDLTGAGTCSRGLMCMAPQPSWSLRTREDSVPSRQFLKVWRR